MSKKMKIIKPKEEPIVSELVLEEPAFEEVVPEEPKPIPPPVVSKQVQVPVLQIEEVARGFRQYRPHHLQSIVSFCSARGYPTQGTKEQLLEILSHFGW